MAACKSTKKTIKKNTDIIACYIILLPKCYLKKEIIFSSSLILNKIPQRENYLNYELRYPFVFYHRYQFSN